MTSLLLKFMTCPIGVILAMILFADVYYPNFIQPIIIGIILAVVGVAMEFLILKEGTLPISLLVDFVVTIFIMYFVSYIFTNASVTLFGAFLTAVLLGITEYFIHQYLLKSGNAKKTEKNYV